MPRAAASPKVTPGELPESPRTVAAKTAANVRWALTKASDEDLITYFKELPVAEALPLIDKARHNLELACKVVQSKIEATNQLHCEWCNGARKGMQWRMVKPIRNSKTRQIENIYFCSDVCIALYNQKTQGVAAIPDRGMSRGSSIPDHPAVAATK